MFLLAVLVALRRMAAVARPMEERLVWFTGTSPLS